MRKFLLLTLLSAIFFSSVRAQSFSNKGKEFFLCFPNHVHNSAANQATLSIFVTSDQASSGTISMANGFFSGTFNLTAANGFFQEIQILPIQPPATPGPSPAQIFSTESNLVGQKSIKVSVNAGQPDVVVYAQQWAGARTAATLVLPSNVLGKKYIASSYTQNGTSNGAGHQAKSQFQVIAVKPNTTVQVTPRFNGVTQPSFNIVLPNVGDIYQYQPTSLSVDITGTIIESIASGTSACLPIAVFSGSSNLTVSSNVCTGNSYDPLWQQLYPVVSLGKSYGFIPFALYNSGNFFRVIASEANTRVFINGTLVTTLANAGDIYPNTFTSSPTLTTTASLISADKPISVAHYCQTQACAGGQTTLGDPDMVMLNSIEQNINDITVFSSNTQNITNKFINILIPTNGTTSFRLSRNGGPLLAPNAAWQNFAPLPGYSFIRENIATSITRVRLFSDSGFNAIAYGFGAAESYAYSAGTNVRDFNQQLFTPSEFGIINDGTSYACLNTPFKFSLYLPESALSNSGPTAGTIVPIRYDSMRWSVTSATNFVPNNFPAMVRPSNQVPPGLPQPPTYPNPVVREDSITIRNGKPVAWYSLPTQYNITAPGTYIISVKGYRTNNSGDGCTSGNETDFDFTLVIPPAPTATFTNTLPGCPADPVQFTETNPQTPYSSSTYLFTWNFGDPASGAANTSNVRNPVHTFSGPGTYQVSFSNITTAGCVSATTTQEVIVPDLVNATISGSTSVCQNAPSPNLSINITNGRAPYTINYTLSTNGGTPVAQTPIVTSSFSNPLPIPTGVVGTFVYTLTSISNANPAFCIRNITGQSATVIVRPLPTATISGTTIVCQNTPQPSITFTGANATAPYTFTYNINGGANLTVTTLTGNSVTVPVPTNTINTYTYNLVSVSESSSNTCTNPATGNAVVQVQATSTATISGSASVCQDATAPVVTFTASNGTAPFTFEYNINGGATQTITTTATSNSVTLSVPMAATGTFVYNLTSVRNTGPTLCLTPITNQAATVVINPNPTATITGSNIVCQNTGGYNITFTGAGGTAPYTFTYNINGGPNLTATTVTGNSITVPVSSATIGIFTYTLTLVRDASVNTLCSRAYTTNNTAVFQVQATSSATISGTTTLCQDAAAPTITFTASNGNAPFTFEYNINGGATQTISTTATSNSVTLPVPMATTGTFVYNLTSVRNTGPILCLTPITTQSATVVIKPIPAATIVTNRTTVCQNATSPVITFTGSNATAPYTFTYNINGGAPTTISTVAGNSITLNVPTATPGTYTYNLTRVVENTGCLRNYTNTSVTVIVRPLATATINGTGTVCQAGTSPVITFTATGGVAPYTFAYTLNGTPLTVTTTVGNTVTVPVSTTNAGTFVYNLVSVQESSNENCVNNQTGTATVIVHPKPTASYALTAPYCAEKAITFTPTFGITPTGSVVSWVWNYGDGTGQQIRTDGNPFTLTYPTAGVKPVSFKVVSDNNCESNLATTPTVIINSKPVAGFINPEACLADANAQFTDTSTVVGGTIVNWEWDFGDATPILSGGTPAIRNPLHAYATVGQKTVTLIVTTNSGCKDTVVQQFFINGEVTSADFIPQNGGAFCSNRPVQIRENSVVNVGGLIRVDIYWDNVGAPTTVETDDLPTPNKIYSHSYPNLQVDRTYAVRYIAYSGFNGVCQKEVTKNIVVRAAPVASFAPPINVCLNGGPIQLTGSEIGGVGGTTVYMGTGVSNTGLFNPLTAGAGTTSNITFTAISPNGCDSALVRPIHVYTPPVANFTTVGNICVGANNVVTFSQSSTPGEGGAIVRWIYDWGDGSPVQTFTNGGNVTHSYATAGIKTAHLIVEDAFGCRNAAPGKPLTFTVNPVPVPSYTFSNSVCLPNANISFTNTTQNLASNSYQWSFELPSTSAANTSTAINPSHIYTSQGPFNTHLIATNITTGCKDSTAIIVINGNTIHPAPVVIFDPVSPICLNNGTVQLTQGSETSGIAGGPGIYSGTGVSGSGVFNPLVAGVGTHTLTFTFTSTFNCPASVTRDVTVLAAPVVNTFTTVGNKCERNAIEFTNTVTQGAGTINQWVYDWGDGTPPQTATNGNNITHTYAVAGTYSPTLYVVTNNNCRSLVKTMSPALVVNVLPIPSFTFSDTACLPQASVLFKNTTPNINDWAYSWNFSVPSTLSSDMSTQQNNITHIYNTVGPHSVRLIAQSGTTGCVDSTFKNVTTIHPAPTANFNFSKPAVCIGDFVNVIDASNPADGFNVKWEWNYDDNTTATGATPAAHTFPTARDYNVKLKITNNWGCVDDTARLFTVHPFPTANAGRDSVILQGGDITLTPIVTGNELTYVWSGTPAPENLSNKFIKNPIATPVEDITYKLEVTGRGGCKAPADFVFIKVLKAPVVPNTFTPNNDGVHDTWVIKYLESYPDNRVQVFTRAGQLVFESRRYVKPWDGTLNGKSLPFDTYYYIIEPGTGRTPLTGYVTIVK
jgi:gliding motility-associated-like protein